MRALALAFLFAFPALASAQDPTPTELPPVVVHGSPPAPITIFVPRSRIRYETRHDEHHAVDRIVESVRHAPF